MNTRSFYFGILRQAAIGCAGVGLITAAITVTGAEPEKTNPPASAAPTATNSVAKPVTIEIPLSQFAIPASPSEGRNPFFPDSTIGKKVVETSTTAPVKVVVALDIKGVSKVGNKWYALINGRTFEAGEEGDVTMPGGKKVHVLCISIKAEGATVEADGVRQELKLKVY